MGHNIFMKLRYDDIHTGRMFNKKYNLFSSFLTSVTWKWVWKFSAISLDFAFLFPPYWLFKETSYIPRKLGHVPAWQPTEGTSKEQVGRIRRRLIVERMDQRWRQYNCEDQIWKKWSVISMYLYKVIREQNFLQASVPKLILIVHYTIIQKSECLHYILFPKWVHWPGTTTLLFTYVENSSSFWSLSPSFIVSSSFSQTRCINSVPDLEFHSSGPSVRLFCTHVVLLRTGDTRLWLYIVYSSSRGSRLGSNSSSSWLRHTYYVRTSACLACWKNLRASF